MAHGESYEEFIDKFKEKKTTDDCYTPPIIYEAVAKYVEQEYGVDRDTFIRPFKPNGDYESEDYTGRIVVDNPPFSILAKIVRFYVDRGIKFFLFAPTLTLFTTMKGCTAIVVGANITYENGAKVSTSFITNMEDIQARSAPNLYKAIESAEQESQYSKRSRKLPMYIYPDNLLTASELVSLSKNGVVFEVKRQACVEVSRLDSQKQYKRKIYGGGLLLSNTVAKQLSEAKEKAQQAQRAQRAQQAQQAQQQAQQWALSEREIEIINKLGSI